MKLGTLDRTCPNWQEVIFKTSSKSNDQGLCVKVGIAPQAVGVCDSKDPAGPILAFDRSAWASFASAVPVRN